MLGILRVSGVYFVLNAPAPTTDTAQSSVDSLVVVFLGHAGLEYTSTDEFCNLCHVHPHVTYSWKKSTHYKNKSGVVIHCVECHLPPGGINYFTEKARLGIRDAYGTLFKDTETIDWDAKSILEHAVTYTYDSSCIRCHQDLYSRELSPKGVEYHEYYMKNPDEFSCIKCHLTVGHYHEEPVETEFVLGKLKISLQSRTHEEPVKEKPVPGVEEHQRPEKPIDTDELKIETQTIPDTDVVQESQDSPTNLVDAITKATEFNAHEGSEKYLTDGKYPSNDKNTTYFGIKSKGILSIVLPKPTEVESVRVFFGEKSPGVGLIIAGYLGGKLDLKMGERKPDGNMIIMAEQMDVLPNQWNIFNIEGKVVDNFDLYNYGTATYYEIQVVASK